MLAMMKLKPKSNLQSTSIFGFFISSGRGLGGLVTLGPVQHLMWAGNNVTDTELYQPSSTGWWADLYGKQQGHEKLYTTGLSRYGIVIT